MYKMSETLTSHGGWVPISGSPAQCRINSAYPSSILEQISRHVLCLYLFSVSSDHLESRTIFPYHRSKTHLKKTFCRIPFSKLPHLWKFSGSKHTAEPWRFTRNSWLCFKHEGNFRGPSLMNQPTKPLELMAKLPTNGCDPSWNPVLQPFLSQWNSPTSPSVRFRWHPIAGVSPNDHS